MQGVRTDLNPHNQEELQEIFGLVGIATSQEAYDFYAQKTERVKVGGVVIGGRGLEPDVWTTRSYEDKMFMAEYGFSEAPTYQAAYDALVIEHGIDPSQWPMNAKTHLHRMYGSIWRKDNLNIMGKDIPAVLLEDRGETLGNAKVALEAMTEIPGIMKEALYENIRNGLNPVISSGDGGLTPQGELLARMQLDPATASDDRYSQLQDISQANEVLKDYGSLVGSEGGVLWAEGVVAGRLLKIASARKSKGIRRSPKPLRVTASNARLRFKKSRPDLPDDWAVHHSIPQQYEDFFRMGGVNIQDTQYLRGVSQPLHSRITAEWARFHAETKGYPSPAQVAEFARHIDRKYGDYFMWPGV